MMTAEEGLFFDPKIEGLYSLLAQDEVKGEDVDGSRKAEVPQAQGEVEQGGADQPRDEQASYPRGQAEKEDGEQKSAGRGFMYYPESGLNIVAYGPSGVGKTILALQMAVAARDDNYHVLYFTKDTPASVLIKRSKDVFGSFSSSPIDEKSCFLLRPPEKDRRPVTVPGYYREVTEEQLAPGASSPLPMNEGFLAFADFDEIGGISSWADRYQNTSSPFDALGHLQPDLRPLFDRLQEAESKIDEAKDGQLNTQRRKGLFVICDSLRPEIVEEHLRYQPQFKTAGLGKEANQKLGPGVFLFVMEGAEMPQTLTVAFPPDIHMRMAFRDEHHGIRSRVLQLMKTRYQKSLDEEAPFIILGKKEAQRYASRRLLDIASRRDFDEQDDPRKPGITVMPPVAQEPTVRAPVHGNCTPKTELQRVVRFGVEGIDGFTQEGNLAGGGCTLLVTQNRCGSTVLSLHYLLAQIGDAKAPQEQEGPAPPRQEQEELVPRSVLYISLSGEIDHVLHTVWRHSNVRQALKISPDSKPDWPALWKELDKQLRVEMLRHGTEEGLPHGDRIYDVAMEHGRVVWEQAGRKGEQPKNCQPHFFVYVPAFRWVTPEEALDGIARLLRFHRGSDKTCRGCRRVDRVVLDRVGRLQSRWPLVKEHEVFVSGLASLCRQSQAELMIIDDTAETTALSGVFRSRWAGVAQNIVQLRRTSFHGTEAMTIELVRAAGRVTVAKRPYETVFLPSVDHSSGSEMRVEDSFRGYTALFTGEPRRCRLLVELSYDEKGTPLYHELTAAKQNIEASTDDVEVRLMGSGEWSGINSAYHDLSAASRDACHIVAIDCVWMENLIEAKVLHPFEPDELCKVLPNHIRHGVAAALLDEELGEKAKGETSQRSDLLKKLTSKENRESATYRKIERWLSAKTGEGWSWRRVFQDPSSATGLDLTTDDIAGLEKAVVILADATSRGEAFKNQYVTQSLTVALTSRQSKNPHQVGVYDELRYAIPMRHNWGVLAVSRPEPRRVEQVLGKICAELEKQAGAQEGQADGNLEGRLTDRLSDLHRRPWKEVGEVVAAVVGLLTPKDGANEVPKQVRDALWSDEGGSDSITWRELARFRIRYWHHFWEGGWVEHALSSMSASTVASADLWTVLFPRIDFFSLATGLPESVVAFFLELLLAEVQFSAVFAKYESTGSKLPRLYRFVNEEGPKLDHARTGIANTLLLFCALLSKTQRRQIAIGAMSGHHHIGPIRAQRMMGAAEPSHSPFADWPAQIALFSREWLSTVPDLLPRYDIRHAIHLRHLPRGSADNSYWEEIGLGQQAPVGPTVGGPWYLGILRGGNADLGTDLMKDILAPEHEVWSSFSGSAGPVSKKYYDDDGGGGGNGRGGKQLPYMQRIKEVSNSESGAVFPFDRNQIVNCLEVSPILYDMIRHVMSMSIEIHDEGILARCLGIDVSKESDGVAESKDLQQRVEGIVATALVRISNAQGQGRGSQVKGKRK